MKQRGRISQAALSVVTPIGVGRHEPPEELTPEQAAFWRALVERMPADWFKPGDLPLLTAYCRAADRAALIARKLDLFKPEWLDSEEGVRRWESLARMEREQAKLMSSLATKMRLTQQSRYSAKSAGTAADRATSARKPWDFPIDPAPEATET